MSGTYPPAWWADAHFGTAETPLPDYRASEDAPDPDDELLPETPRDVVMMLGFDPRTEAGFNDVADEGPADPAKR